MIQWRTAGKIVVLAAASLCLRGGEDGVSRPSIALTPGAPPKNTDTLHAPWNLGWYNVENLFDNQDDSLVRDEEFAADGAKEYTPQLYRLKVQRVAKVLGWLFHQTGAVAVGLCEVENSRVLDDLLRTPPLDQFSLWRVHRDSPDPRGIDVAVLYRADCVHVANAAWILPHLPDERGTREAVVVTLVRGARGPQDTLRVGWTHLPSQRSGDAHARSVAWQSLEAQASGCSVWLGDVNEAPGWQLDAAVAARSLVSFERIGVGTYYYRDAWSWLDRGWSVPPWRGTVRVLSQPWMGSGARDLKTGLAPPWRTWRGEQWSGGPSDHYPIHVQLTRI
jgi:hypothetical protein